MTPPTLHSFNPKRTISPGREVKPKFFEYIISEGANCSAFVFAIWDLNRDPDHCVELLEKRLDRFKSK